MPEKVETIIATTEKEEGGDSALEFLLSGKKLAVPRALALAVSGVAVLFALFHIYTGFFSQIDPFAQRFITISLLLVLAFLRYPLGRKSWKEKLNWFFLVDVACILICIAVTVYVIAGYKQFIFRSAMPIQTDIIAGTIIMIFILELTRRVIGYPMLVLAMVLLLQNLFAEYLPGFLYGWSIPWKKIVAINFMQDFGIYGSVTAILTSYLILFLVLAAFLTTSGAGKFFIDFAMTLAGRYTGGPAKVAVIASSLFGTMSGSSVANVVGTGTFTIPLMKSIGYKPHFAGAVEATASNGGQLMPPIMGSTAFLVAEFLGISYWRVCLAALIPTILYYTGVFMQVHYEAVRMNLRGISKADLPRLKSVLSGGWPFLIPILSLFYFLGMQYSLSLSAIYAMFLFFVIAMIKKNTRLTATTLIRAFEQGGSSAVTVGVACACAGIIIGTFYVSGLGDTLSNLIVSVSGGNLLIALAMTGLVCIVLGMGMPTPIVYVTVYLFAIPALVKLGATPLAAHFFTFYFGVSASITPPVAMAAFAGAAIAGADMMKTGWQASKIGIVAFIVPFMFVYAPSMLLEGPLRESLLYLVTGFTGVVVLASGVEGYLFRNARWYERVLAVAGGVLLMTPGLVTIAVGLVLSVFTLSLQKDWLFVLKKR